MPSAGYCAQIEPLSVFACNFSSDFACGRRSREKFSLVAFHLARVAGRNRKNTPLNVTKRVDAGKKGAKFLLATSSGREATETAEPRWEAANVTSSIIRVSSGAKEEVFTASGRKTCAFRIWKTFSREREGAFLRSARRKKDELHLHRFPKRASLWPCVATPGARDDLSVTRSWHKHSRLIDQALRDSYQPLLAPSPLSMWYHTM